MVPEKIYDSAWWRVLIATNQIIVYLLFSRPVRWYSKNVTADIPDAINSLERGSMIMANHQSKLDPFIILAHVPLRVMVRLVPIRIPTYHYYFNKVRYWWLPLVGSYPVGDSKKERMLTALKTRQYLQAGMSVLIFPEGKRARTDRVGTWQEGVKFFQAAATGLLLVRIKGFTRGSRSRKRSITYNAVPLGHISKRGEVSYLRESLIQLTPAQ